MFGFFKKRKNKYKSEKESKWRKPARESKVVDLQAIKKVTSSQNLNELPDFNGNGRLSVPIPGGNGSFVEADDISDIPEEYLAEPVEDGIEIQRYLRQKGSGKLFVYTRKLAERDDMEELHPQTAEKFYNDIMAIQNVERQWKKRLTDMPMNQLKMLAEKERQASLPDSTTLMEARNKK